MSSETGSGPVRVEGPGAPSRIAGALAELGITTLELRSPGQPAHPLAARGTDLPGLLGSAMAGAVLVAGRAGITITVDRSGFSWSADDPAVRRELERLLG